MTALIKFHRLMPSAILPMRADKSALGGMPAAAYQYCEALRTGSAYGWYLFPPRDLELRWDGAQASIRLEGEWTALASIADPEFAALWAEHAPARLQGSLPPYVSQLFVPGIVQVWTGLLVQTAPGWSVLARPLANVVPARTHHCFEGMIETDWFRPVPLFVNIRLLATDQVIRIARTQPLFQLQPVAREAYTGALDGADTRSLPHGELLQEEEWNGLASTLRSISPERPHDFGRYGAEVRRRQKSAACPHAETAVN